MNDIKKQLLKGSIYTALSKYLNIGCQLIVTAFLARLLSPADFGLVAITTVIIMFFDILADVGFGPAIIQNRDMSDKDINHVYSFSIYFSVVLVAVFIICIKPIAIFYEEKSLVNLCFVLSFQLIFTTFNIVPKALMLKFKKFRSIAVVSIVNSIVFGILSVAAAFCGLGIYSLLIVPVGNSISTFWVYKHQCGVDLVFYIKPSFEPVKKLLSFSLYQFSFNFANYFSRNLDKILIGRFIGMDSLGYYEKSYRLMTLPISTLQNVLTPTIQPVLSEYQNNKELIYEYYKKISKVFLVAGVIVTSYFFFCSRELIFLIFGSQWNSAVPIFRILSLSIFTQLLDSLSGGFLQASNSVKYLFKTGIYSAVINVTMLVIPLLVFKDLEITAYFITIAFYMNFILALYYVIFKAFRTSVCDYLTIFPKPMILFLVLMIGMFFINSLNFDILLGLCFKTIYVIASTLLFAFKARYVNLKKILK